MQQQWEEEAATVHTTLWVGLAQTETLLKQRMNAGSVSRDGRVVEIYNLAVSPFSVALAA